MDVLRSGKRWKYGAVAAGLLIAATMPLAPAAALAAPDSNPPGQTSNPPGQSVADAHRSGPGFDEHHEIRDGQEFDDVNVCSKAVASDQAHCDARIRTDATAKSSKPARAGQAQPAGAVGNNGGYDPSYLQSAYNLKSAIQAGAGTGQVVAIVDAQDDPNAAADLANYRWYFGLPALPNCTTWPSSVACFKKIDQFGGTSYPAPNQGWAEEISLDLDMVSATCPNCTILLVEANSASYSDLGTAVNEAVSLGANVVSNSYGGGEWSFESSMDGYYNHAGIAITVSSGDGGYGTEYPAASPYVTAVGGTTLNQSTNTGTRNATETAWSGAGSGCSAYESKPSWQKDTGCGTRTVADVSAVADPGTGVWIYDTYIDPGWEIFGGTSAAAPIVGSVYALAGNSRSSTGTLSADPYANFASLFDSTSGSNGTCSVRYLCNSVAGYDGPTGLGTPNGTAAFSNTVSAPQPAADFTLAAASTTPKVTRGGSTIGDTLTLTAINGYHSSVQLSISRPPTGVTASFSASLVTPTATTQLKLHAAGSTVRGTYPLTITATGSDGTKHTQTIQLTVQ
jgi:subtilase family serine protease